MQYAFTSLRKEYSDLWSRMKVVKIAEATAQAKKIIAPSAKARYKKIERATGVPWFVVGCLHMRESNANFKAWLHNGDPMRDKQGRPVKTVNVPKGRPPNPNCTFEDGAYDALVVVEHLDEITDWGPEHVAYAAEKFNGFGYRSPSRNIPSPYLWGGTSVQRPGKFVRDGKYDASVVDPQIGAMAVLKQIMDLDQDAKFTVGPPPANSEPSTDDVPAATKADTPPAKETTPAPLSPAAIDEVSEIKPLAKSKSIWGGIMQWLAGVGATLAGMFQYIATPWGFAVTLLIIVSISVGLYLVIKGRIDVNKIVEHLSQDD